MLVAITQHSMVWERVSKTFRGERSNFGRPGLATICVRGIPITAHNVYYVK